MPTAHARFSQNMLSGSWHAPWTGELQGAAGWTEIKYDGKFCGIGRLTSVSAKPFMSRDWKPKYEVGIEQFSGSVNGLQGTFLLLHTSLQPPIDRVVDGSISIIEHTGTGALTGITGQLRKGCGYDVIGDADHRHPCWLNYALPV